MPWYVYLIIAFVLAIALNAAWIQYQARRMKGGRIDRLPGSLSRLDPRRPVIVYAFSPNCGPCKAISPRIDEMIAEGLAIGKLDVQREPEAAARLNIRATPTFVMIRDGRVEGVALGAQNPTRLRRFLQG